MTKSTVKLAIIFSLQAVLMVFLYRCRAISHASWAASDSVIFGLPVLLGLAVAATIIFSRLPMMPVAQRITVTLGLSFAGAMAASLVGVGIALNLYGS